MGYGVAWGKDRLAADEPFFAYIAPKAPHIQDGPGWPVALAAPAWTLGPSVERSAASIF